MKKVNTEVQRVIARAKKAQGRLQEVLKKQDWVEEARKYAEKQSKEVRKLLSTDALRVKTFLERERKELERLQKQLPGEIEKLRSFVQFQKKELQTLVSRVRKAHETRQAAKKAPTAAAPKKKRARAKKK